MKIFYMNTCFFIDIFMELSQFTSLDQRQLFFPTNDNYFSRYPTIEYLLTSLMFFFRTRIKYASRMRRPCTSRNSLRPLTRLAVEEVKGKRRALL